MRHSLKRSLAITGIGLGLTVEVMIWSIVNTGLASIQKDLSASVLQLQWLMNCLGIFLVIPLLTMGKLGDAYGRKKLFLWGLVIALVAALIAGFATHVGVLIACMGALGFSGSIVLPLSQALIVHQFPEREKGKAVGLWAIIASIGVAGGPIVGGVILSWLGWRWIYWIDVPIVLLSIATVFFFVEKEKESHKPHCDWAGVSLLAITIGSLIVGIMQGPTWGWSSYSVLGVFALFIISLCAFIALERKAKEPLFRPDLFSNRTFLFSAIPNGCTIGTIWVSFFMIPLYVQNMRHLNPLATGCLLLLASLPVAFLSITVSKLYQKLGARPLMLSGFALLAVAALLQVVMAPEPSFWPVAIGCLILGCGWVLAWGPSTSSALSSIPHRLAGMASGMFTTLQETGAVLCLAVAGVFFRSAHTRLLAPEMGSINSALKNFTPEQIESLTANPVAVETQLGASAPILPALREAFLSGYQDAFWFLFALSLFAFAITLLLPKHKNVRK